jgi:peptidyl-tRNA hydrolase
LVGLNRRLDWLAAWEATGEKTIVLALDNSQMGPAIIEKAHNFMLLTHIVQDAGNTEVRFGKWSRTHNNNYYFKCYHDHFYEGSLIIVPK